MDGVAVAGTLTSAAAAVAAAWAANETRRLVRIESERRQAEREAALVADLRASHYRRTEIERDVFDQTPRPRSVYLFRLENLGPAEARNIEVTFEAQPRWRTGSDSLPRELRSGQRVDLSYSRLPGRRYGATVTWNDGRGPNELAVLDDPLHE